MTLSRDLRSSPYNQRACDNTLLLCPIRAVRTYIERSRQLRLSEQLFVCFGGCTKGLPVSKQRLSHWIVDAIALAYSSKGVECSTGVRAHSTRRLPSSWAWANGISIQDICMAAGWSTPSTCCQCKQRTRLLSLSYDLRCVSVVLTRSYTPCIDAPPIQCCPYQFITLL